MHLQFKTGFSKLKVFLTEKNAKIFSFMFYSKIAFVAM
jgi:hypothetical protein